MTGMQLDYLDFESSEAKKNPGTGFQGIDSTINFTSVAMDKGVLRLDFVYLATYAPTKSFIKLSGKAGFSGPEAKAAADDWTKTKKIAGATGEQIVNAINYNASINAVFIARVFNLTPPIMPPTIKFEK